MTKAQYEHAMSPSLLPRDLRRLLETTKSERGGSLAVTISRGGAEAIRSVLTDRLARAGFDRDYALTAEGQQLEELIDLFLPREP